MVTASEYYCRSAERFRREVQQYSSVASIF